MSETLAAEARFELEVRKSRFLVHAAPVESPEAAHAFLTRVSTRDATHNCWAYRVGQQYRFSDDGEPAGTAGKPMLVAIDAQGLDQVIGVVTRWYGGIKLGAGGLARAYGGSLAECLRRAERRALVEQTTAILRCEFDHLGLAHALLAQHAAVKLEQGYETGGLWLRFNVAAKALDALEAALREATRGRGSLVRE